MVHAGNIKLIWSIEDGSFYQIHKFQPPRFYNRGDIGGESTHFLKNRIFGDFLLKKR